MEIALSVSRKPAEIKNNHGKISVIIFVYVLFSHAEM